MKTKGLMDSLPVVGNLSLLMLKEQALKQTPEAIRELSRYLLKYAENDEQLSNGRLMLLSAACMADRGASWLLAKYYRTGKYGFKKDIEVSEDWGIKTEDRLRSDASLIYDDEELKEKAIMRYQVWCEQWNITKNKKIK